MRKYKSLIAGALSFAVMLTSFSVQSVGAEDMSEQETITRGVYHYDAETGEETYEEVTYPVNYTSEYVGEYNVDTMTEKPEVVHVSEDEGAAASYATASGTRKITLSESAKNIYVGERTTLKAKGFSAKNIEWSSSDISVAKVNSSGVITAKKTGYGKDHREP